MYISRSVHVSHGGKATNKYPRRKYHRSRKTYPTPFRGKVGNLFSFSFFLLSNPLADDCNAEQLKMVQTYLQKAFFLRLQLVLSLERRGVLLEKKEGGGKELTSSWKN